MNQFGHVMNDSAAVHDFDFKILATKVHHMIKIHNELAAFRHVENPLSTIVTTGRSVKNMLTIKSHKQLRFQATRKLEWGVDPSTELSMTFSETTSDRSTSLIIETA